MARVQLHGVTKRYGDVVGVDDVSLDVVDGEFLAFLGPSGCGKTSTMRMIAGLEAITSGTITIGDRRVNDLSPAERNVAMAFENYGLYPHMTVFGNIAYPMRIRGHTRDQIEREVIQTARLLHIDDVLDRRPGELSGGVRQRISLARALVRKPSVFLMDEPISHLDADLRSRMRGELKRLHSMKEATTIYVTHDQLEAMSMSDRIAVMHQGRFQQVGTPAEVFRQPANRFVASFIGEPPMNLLPAQVAAADGGGALVSVDDDPILSVSGAVASGLLAEGGTEAGGVEIGIRPVDFQLAPAGSAGLPGRIRVAETLGEISLLTVDAGEQRLRVQVPATLTPAEGDEVVLVPRPDRVHFFSMVTGDAIRAHGQ